MSQKHFKIGVLTLSDKGSRGEREDESGPLLQQMVAPLGDISCYQVMPDDLGKIVLLLKHWVDDLHLDLILTTGGTGLSPRDLTPQATEKVIDYQVPGMAEAMRAASYLKTPHSMISRAVAGVRKMTLIVNLPGSPKGAQENFAVLLPALPHALVKLQGDMSDCAHN